MAEKNGILVSSEAPKDRKNAFPFFPDFGFKFPFQFRKKEPIPAKEPEPAGGESEGGSTSEKPDVVRFPHKSLEPPPPLKLEVEEESGKTSNPVILWQVRRCRPMGFVFGCSECFEVIVLLRLV